MIPYSTERIPEQDKAYMDKSIHERNAFEYSCWGANVEVPTQDEIDDYREQFGFGALLVGGDGNAHKVKQTPAIYSTEITIPTVVPDGNYILGWVWFGGMRGGIVTNDPQVPDTRSAFGDYWGCSFIAVQGGTLASEYMPVFKNEYKFAPFITCLLYTSDAADD